MAKVIAGDLPLKLQGADATEPVIQVISEAGTVVFEIMGNGAFKFSNTEVQQPLDAATATTAQIVAALIAAGIVRQFP